MISHVQQAVCLFVTVHHVFMITMCIYVCITIYTIYILYENDDLHVFVCLCMCELFCNNYIAWSVHKVFGFSY